MDNRIKLIIFSKDRPMQLFALIESFLDNCEDATSIDKYVIYKESEEFGGAYEDVIRLSGPEFKFIKEENFQNELSSLVSSDKKDYITFLVDDIIFRDTFKMSDCIGYMDSHKECFTFSLRLGRGVTYCYPTCNHQVEPKFTEENGILSFMHHGADGDWGYPFSLDGNIFRIDEFIRYFAYSSQKSPNALESSLSTNKGFVLSRTSACFESAKLFNNPDNRVQDDFKNRTETQDNYRALIKTWGDGYKIDTKKLHHVKNDSCHYPVRFEFIKR